MSNRRFSLFAAATLALVASSPALAASNGAAEFAKMDCAALGKETVAIREAEVKLTSAMTTPAGLANAQKMLDEMSRLADRGTAIQKQKEAKRCPGAVIDKNDLGK